MRTFISYLLFALLSVTARAQPPLRVVIAGLTHGHVNGLFYEYRHGQYSNMQIIGIAEPDTALWHKYGKLYLLL